MYFRLSQSFWYCTLFESVKKQGENLTLTKLNKKIVNLCVIGYWNGQGVSVIVCLLGSHKSFKLLDYVRDALYGIFS